MQLVEARHTLTKSKKRLLKGALRLSLCQDFYSRTQLLEHKKEFPDVNFIFVDGAPSETPQSEPVIGPNMYSVVWEEQQAGFLAGYAAVKDGYTKLGYIGGMKVPAVEKFGLGYVYGANHAAEELGITVDMMYKYSGTFEASQEVQMLASGWYAGGTEVIFVSAGGAGPSVFKAAEDKEAKVIGVDVDQSGESETIITSALKELQLAVYEGLKAHYDGKFPGGTQHAYNINDDGVGLPKNFDRFKTFKQEDLEKVIADMKADKDGVTSTIKKQHADDFTDVISDPILKNINITFIK
ncbi:BMP family ABC transporter substrate-binding protein [Erysipelothrix piscisicarius]|uniref:BMP family lipoprotein n=1 Tax=Erysipelothrix piscisicarius TaxID=2485784 RepID=UPI002F92C019